MMNDRFCTFIVPLFLVAIFVISLVLYKYFTPNSDPIKQGVPDNRLMRPLNNVINAMCFCETGDQQSTTFYNTTLPALGGVDMVQFFTAFKLPDGTYNESEVGQLGSNQYSSSYNNNTYNFVSEANLRIFESNPSFYAPQWGGFDAWSVASNACPTVEWSPSCKFSQSSLTYWTIQFERLYFFSKAGTKQLFLFEVITNDMAGDAKWEGLYPDGTKAPMLKNMLEDPISITNSSVIENPPVVEKRYLKRRVDTKL